MSPSELILSLFELTCGSIAFSIALSYDPFRSKADSSALKRALEFKAILEPSCLVLQKLSACVTKQLENCKSQIEALRSRATFSSMPDEILTSVLGHAAYCPKDKYRGRGYSGNSFFVLRAVKSAIQLSSVCSRFRHVVIHSPDLWNRVCVDMHRGLLSTCVHRSGATGIEVFFDIEIGERTERWETRMFSFLEFVMSFSGTWRLFDYHCLPYLNFGNSLPEVDMAVLEVMTRNLYAPQLSELVVQYHNDDEIDFYEVTPREDLIDFQRKLHYYSSWTLPGLRHVYNEYHSNSLPRMRLPRVSFRRHGLQQKSRTESAAGV